MATRKAQVIIEVDDRSLVELNSEIKTLEQSIQNLKIGTKEWNEANAKLGGLKDKFAQATAEAKKLQGQVQKISSPEQLKSIAKLGAGMVGTFTAVSGSLKMLGVNSEAFDEMTAKAATLMSIMGGLNQLSETFSAANMKGLKAVGQSFGTLVRTVKTASLAMKTALITTGIGALVVAVGLLIANFDKIINFVTGKNAKEKKGLEDNLKLAESNQKLEEERARTAKSRLDLSDKLLTAERKAAFAADLDKTAKDAALKTEQARQDLLEKELKDIGTRDTKKKNQARAEKQAEIDISKEKQKQLTLDIEILNVQTDQAKLVADIADSQKQYTEAIAESENKLIVLNAQLYKSEQIYQQELKILDEKIAAAWDKITKSAAGTSLETLAQLDTLEAQRKALIIQNDIRKAQLKTDIALLENDNLRNYATLEYNQSMELLNYFIQSALNKEKNVNVIYEDRVKLIDGIEKALGDGKKVRDDIVNFDVKRNDILNDRLKRLYPSEAKVTTEMFNKLQRFIDVYKDFGGLQIQINENETILVDSIDSLGSAMEKMYESTRQDLELQGGLSKNYEDRSRMGKQILDDSTQQLILVKIQSQAEVEALEKKSEYLKKQQEYTQNILNSNVELRKTLYEQVEPETKRVEELKKQAELLKDKKGKEEEYYAKLQEVDKAQQDLNNLLSDFNTINKEVQAQEQQILDYTIAIKDNELARADASAKVADEQEKIGNSLEEQLRVSELLKGFTEKYAEEIQAALAAITNSMEMIAAFQDRKAQESQERIDQYTEQLEELDEAEEDRMSKLDDYNELLKDANGERYDELLRLTAQEEAANIQAQDNEEAKRTEIEAKIKDEENKKLAAEARAAKWRKAAALVDAVVQGALAVIKALPNVFLAVATGVAAAAGIAVIAAQKTPDIPEGYVEGGFTAKAASNKQVAGVVHANEYVAPAFVTQSPEAQAHIAALEAQRLRGYAEGGMVMPATNTSGTDYIDYDRLISGIAGAIRLMPNPIVSVQKITATQNEVKVTKQLAGL